MSTDADWTTLVAYLGGDSSAGGKLKESSFTHWHDPNTGATNESGFSALPGGMRFNAFWNIGTYGGLWSYPGSKNGFEECRFVINTDPKVGVLNYNSSFGMSIRCVKN